MKAALLLLLALAACQPCSRVILDITVQQDGGLADGGAPAAECMIDCVTTADCPKGQHCSWHPNDPAGLCFPNEPDGGQW